MKIVALVILVFGLLTAAYGLAAVVPRYAKTESAWLSAPRDSASKGHLSDERDELRDRSQAYAMTIVGCGAVALVFTLIGRKKPKPKTGLLIGGSVLCFVLVGVMQAAGNIF